MKRFSAFGQYSLELIQHKAITRPCVYELWANDGQDQTENFLGNNSRFEGKTASDIVDDVFDYADEIIRGLTPEDEGLDGWMVYAYDPENHKNLAEVKMTFSD